MWACFAEPPAEPMWCECYFVQWKSPLSQVIVCQTEKQEDQKDVGGRCNRTLSIQNSSCLKMLLKHLISDRNLALKTNIQGSERLIRNWGCMNCMHHSISGFVWSPELYQLHQLGDVCAPPDPDIEPSVLAGRVLTEMNPWTHWALLGRPPKINQSITHHAGKLKNTLNALKNVFLKNFGEIFEHWLVGSSVSKLKGHTWPGAP